MICSHVTEIYLFFIVWLVLVNDINYSVKFSNYFIP